MKTIITTIFLSLSLIAKAQKTDLLYVPKQNSLVASYSNNYNHFGIYAGGKVFTSFPQPFIYTTPMATFNRLGLNYSTNEFSFMAGSYFEFYNNYEESEFYPDLWLNFYPLRMITQKDIRYDFSVGVNYCYQFNYGVGLSISF